MSGEELIQIHLPFRLGTERVMSFVQNLQSDVRGMRSVVMQSSSVRNLLDLLVQSTNTDTARGARQVAVGYCAILCILFLALLVQKYKY